MDQLTTYNILQDYGPELHGLNSTRVSKKRRLIQIVILQDYGPELHGLNSTRVSKKRRLIQIVAKF
jgi:hypothetical protein